MGATFQADHTERSADQDRLSIETLLTPSSAHPMNGSFRRVSLLASRPGEGRLTEPLGGTRFGRRELVVLPLCRRSRGGRWASPMLN